MISVVLPSRDRPDGLLRSINSLLATMPGQELEIVVVLDEPDAASHEAVRAAALPQVSVVTVGADHLGWPGKKFNAGYRATRGEWILSATDDIEFKAGWLEGALALAETYSVIGLFSDEPQGHGAAMLFLTRRDYVETVQRGYLAMPFYRIWYSDMEVAERARALDQYADLQEPALTHHHPGLGVGVDDHIYQLATQYVGQDEATYRRRKAAGYPDPDPECEL